MTDYNGNVIPTKRSRPEKILMDKDLHVEDKMDSFVASIRVLGEAIGAVKSKHRKGKVDAATLAQCLNIPLEMAKKTILSTTQLAVRTTAEPSLTRKYSTNDRMLRYARLATDTFMDTFFSSSEAGPSIRGYTTCQVFASEFGHVFVVPMGGKSGMEVAQAIKRYFKEVGVPKHLICDQATEQVKGSSRILCNEAGCHVVELEKGTPASNRAERTIKILKDGAKKDMFDSNCPMILWCYCVERRAEIINSTARSNYLLQGQVPSTRMTGQPTDISAICEFGWYQWVIYRLEGEKFPFQHQRLGRVLGPARSAGTAMSQWVMTASGDVMPIQTLRALTNSENNSPTMKERKRDFTRFIKEKFGNSIKLLKQGTSNEYPESIDEAKSGPVDDEIYELYEGWYDEPCHPISDVDEVEDYDLYIDAEVMLPRDGKYLEAARVIGQAKDKNGKNYGTYNQNPVLNTKVYNVMFPDGTVTPYAANIIAENIYSQIDEEGHRYQLMDYIMDHRKDGTAIPISEGYVVAKNGNRVKRQTTKGWYFQIQWKDGTDSWAPLKDLKASHPLQVAEYVQAAELINEPAFS